MDNNNISYTKDNLTELNGGFKYKFSIILAVYNVEEFIDEAVQSLLDQTIGFEENVQLVMVDDGSKDNSGTICDKYKELYPNNITVVHKENGGLCSARNEGLKHVEGRYVNFFDPDDILTPETLSRVYNFFEAHDSQTNIVAIPLHYFGAMNKPHHLNAKFKKGTRVINLLKEPDKIQLSAASSFIKHHIAKEQYYDKRLIIAEDAEQIMKLLIDKPFLGVVHNCKYMYRRRENSQVTGGKLKRGWFNDYVECFSRRTFDYAESKFGYIPKFVQNAVICDLQWHISEKYIPDFLTSDEYDDYVSAIQYCIDKMDDKIVMSQKHIGFDAKIDLISRKYPKNQFVSYTTDNIYLGYDDMIHSKFSNNAYQLNFLETKKDFIELTTRQVLLSIQGKIDSAYVTVNDEIIYADNIQYSKNISYLNRDASSFCICSFKIPKSILTEEKNKIRFFSTIGDITIRNRNLRCGYFFPLTHKYKNSFLDEGGFMFTVSKYELTVSLSNKRQSKKKRKAFYKELWRSNKLGERKAIVARVLAKIYKIFHRKPIWIISDRLNKIGDNGEALFRHLHSIKFDKANFFFAISKCPGYDTLLPLGNVIDRNSLKYKVIHLAADLIISSHADDFVINPFDNYYEPYKDLLSRKKFIFLQHGVTKDDISNWLNKFSKNIKGFVCAATPEHNSIITTPSYYYTENEAWLTGFPRFDRLYNDDKKYITIMPTWRRYLMIGIDNATGVWQEKADFTNSEYFNFYNNLINDERLIEVAKRLGYTICFMPHPNVITKTHLYDKHEDVKFLSIENEYKDVYAQSSLVLTDYSSAVFDFAYLRKPLVYAQFDKNEFFRGEHVYTQGYFDYERDGFGEVAYDYETTVNLLIEYMENGCELKDKYRERIDNFFAFNDKNNCQRILDKILELK